MNYIMNGVNYQTLIMMLSDAPKLIKKRREAKEPEDEASEIVGFFQSKLKR